MTDTDIKLPEPKYIYHPESTPGEGDDDLFVYAESGAVDEACRICERLYTAEQVQEVLADRAERAPAVPPGYAPAPSAVSADTLRIGGFYNWKNQPERLIYLGLCEPRHGLWHQFAKVDSPTVVWSEVGDDDLSNFEVTAAAAPSSAAEPSEQKARFEARFNHLDLRQIPDAWGRPVYMRTHVHAIWTGWLAASQPAPSALEPAVEINRLRNVIQAACSGGLDHMLARWVELFPDAPVPTVHAAGAPPQGEAPHSLPAEFPHYELRFIMRVLSHEGGAPREDWQTAYGMARAIFEAWHAHSVPQGTTPPQGEAAPAADVREPAGWRQMLAEQADLIDDDYRLTRAIVAAPAAVQPIDMILYCPNCGMQHVDAPEQGRMISSGPQAGRVVPPWVNPPHRSHLCHGCKTIWRPSDVPTNGVASIKTEGKADTWPAPHDGIRAQPAAVQPTSEDVDDLTTCANCRGNGYTIYEEGHTFGRRPCDFCFGTGMVSRVPDAARTAQGEGDGNG